MIGGALLAEMNEEILRNGQTMAFIVLALSQVVQAYNMRTDHSLFKIGVFSNKTLNRAALISVALVALVVFTPVREIFKLNALAAGQYLICLGLILVPFVVMELAKFIGKISKKH